MKRLLSTSARASGAGGGRVWLRGFLPKEWARTGKLKKLLMEEILHQLIGIVYPIIYKVSDIPDGAGFLPSAVF